jgi:hypothetical protein
MEQKSVGLFALGVVVGAAVTYAVVALTTPAAPHQVKYQEGACTTTQVPPPPNFFQVPVNATFCWNTMGSAPIDWRFDLKFKSNNQPVPGCSTDWANVPPTTGSKSCTLSATTQYVGTLQYHDASGNPLSEPRWYRTP